MSEELRPRQVLYITLLLSLVAGLLRFYRLDDSVHPDSLLWYGRTQHFWAALAARDFAATNQAPHPGVMLMWISGAVMKLSGTLTGAIDPRGLFALKLPGALVGTVAASLTFPLLLACLGKTHWRPALVLAALLSTEPYLIEQARMAHLDMAGLGFAWLGLLLAIKAYECDCHWSALSAGALFGLACLTKLSYAPLPATLMAILAGTTAFSRFRDRRGLKVAALATLAALVSVFALWPALWVHPQSTLVGMLTATHDLAERSSDAGAGFYERWVSEVSPFETLLLAALGLCVLGSLRHLRKHYLWLILSMVPYLVLISIAPKKLTRYALPAAPLLLLLASAAIEWLLPRLRARLTRAPLAVAALLSLLFAARFARAVGNLPSAQQCTHWPGATCTRPAEMYFMRELALGIAADWRARMQPGAPRVYVAKPQLMSPWLKVKPARSPGRADYVVAWDSDYQDPEAGKLGREARKRFGKLGREVVTVRHAGLVVARVYRASD